MFDNLELDRGGVLNQTPPRRIVILSFINIGNWIRVNLNQTPLDG